jgi:hypothetical protein
MMRWCAECGQTRRIVDEGEREAYVVGNREVTDWVVELSCGHQLSWRKSERRVTEF